MSKSLYGLREQGQYSDFEENLFYSLRFIEKIHFLFNNKCKNDS